MSSGVSEKNIDQMKIPGNSAKNGEEEDVPWSQQVDEASYEDLASSISEDISAAHQNLMQFQYPPFHIKDNAKLPWKNFKSRKTPNNFVDANKKHGKPSFYNVNKRDENRQNSSWFGNSARKTHGDTLSDNVKRPSKFEEDSASKTNTHLHNQDTLEDKRTNDVSIAAAPKKTTWASIASQPAKLTSRTTMTTTSHKKKGPGMPPPPMVPGRHNFDVNTWDLPNNNVAPVPSPPSPVDLGEIASDFPINTSYSEQETGGRLDRAQKGGDFHKTEKSNYNNINYGRSKYSPNGHSRNQPSSMHPSRHSGIPSMGPTRRNENNNANSSRSAERKISYNDQHPELSSTAVEYRDTGEITSNTGAISLTTPQEVLDKLLDKNNYNPTEIDMEKASTARFFVIKSYSEDDIHRSIKYEIWCSTDHGNKRLDDAFRERQKNGGNILLFFSVNGSGHFCGMAQMMTEVDYNSTSSVWSQDKWKGKFKVKWIYVKDVPNFQFRHIRLENNDNKSVTNSRDTQEVPNAKGIQVLQILHTYKHKTSLFDDFYHYEKRQEEEVSSKKPFSQDNAIASQVQSPNSRGYNRQHDSGTQKQIGPAGINARDRNNSYRSNYNDYRRFDSHRSVNMDYQQKDKNVNSDRENSEYSVRYSRKVDYTRRDDSKQNWDKDFSDDYKPKVGGRLRTDSKDFHKDNENVERLRSTDY